MTNLVIFASGKGSNAKAIITYLASIEDINVVGIITNKATAGVLELAKDEDIPSKVFTNKALQADDGVLSWLVSQKAHVIILAGFLLKVPDHLLRAFPDRILNIHPALLPKYGGKGMYGRYVHEAVHRNKEKESGMTIHMVNENYDEGKILFQASTELSDKDTPDDIAAKVLELEHYYYPRVIEAFVQNAL